MATSKRAKEIADPIQSTLPIPEDVVVQILLQMPQKFVFRFKCVSKQCESIVSNPEFRRTYKQQLVSMSSPFHKGMLYPYVNGSYVPGTELPAKYSIECKELLSTPRISSTRYDQSIYYLTSDVSGCAEKQVSNHLILTSSRGLVLSLANYSQNRQAQGLELCVSNPLTKHCVILPTLISPFYSLMSFGLATRVHDSAYKVVFFRSLGGWSFSEIKIFSSDTGVWSAVPGGIMCQEVIYKNFDWFLMDYCGAQDFCYKGILHWLDTDTRAIVTYDPYEKPCRFGQIELPGVESPERIMKSINLIYLDDHENAIGCCEIERDNGTDRSLVVWRLVDYDKGEWCKEKRVSISPLCRIDKWFRKCSQVVARGDAFCCLFVQRKKVKSIDLGSGKKEFVDVSRAIIGDLPSLNKYGLVLFEACPWSSPFHHPKI